MSGILYLVGTPIGNLEDISARALRILSEVDLIAAEDTRVSRRLLNHFGIKKPLISYYEQNKRWREQELLDKLKQRQNIALISDAGMPAISDPGADIAAVAMAADIEIIAIPGACALVTALVISGMDSTRFCFEGFLAREKTARRKQLQGLVAEQRTLIFYESPHRLSAALADMQECFGAERRIVVARELTKLHEQCLRFSLAEATAYFQENQPRGEFVLVVAGAEQSVAEVPQEQQLTQELAELMNGGHSRKQAARCVAEKYHLSVKAVYDLGLNRDEDEGTIYC
ncbi:MAG: 16S rRNA (cytidine(1402)-2'-O)-methyltransferase [Clostridiales bacterium]